MAERAKTTSRRGRTPLSRERVVAAAVELADEGGIEALSMRRLAKELGVEAMSLYNHVANKDDLLDGIADHVMRQIELPSDGDWKSRLRRSAMSAHAMLRKHAWASELVLARALPSGVRRAEWTLRQLREGGFPPETTYHAYHALDAHVLGFTHWYLGHAAIGDERAFAQLAAQFLRDFPRDEYPYMHEHAEQHMTGFGRGQPGAFELVLDLILDGLERARDGA